ncbi:Decapping nuclease rai1 [Hondaea fermentalgiana]|uniref:Decapping nuclease n=1 Tax=Hondaea fermentalgiana TaxID=2315210 RepID=A0A2R5GIT7_9STRA|nr:Decapping nuclease rai1 [Hondaea fermentalgiana]|eukprot:GBG27784.1 Decapping nuclease rai1 [Hondaea fermentalgiana]
MEAGRPRPNKRPRAAPSAASAAGAAAAAKSSRSQTTAAATTGERDGDDDEQQRAKTPKTPKRPALAAHKETLDVAECLKALRRSQIQVGLQQPVEVGCMTRNAQREWQYGDNSGYGLLNMLGGKFGRDLNEGFDDFERAWTPPVPDSLDHILRSLQKAGFERKPAVVAWRGILTKLMCAPFLRRDTFEMAVWKCDGVLYLSNREPPSKVEDDKNMSSKLKRFMYYGYKFEEVMTRPQGKETEARAVDPSECYCRVFKTRVADKLVVAAAEMDCRDPRGSDVELKVTRLLETPSNVRSFERFKLLKWYCQSFLSGVPYILVGFRDDDGSLRKTQFLKTLDIPNGLKEPHWDSVLCIKFLDHVLAWLIRLIPNIPRSSINASPIYLLKTTLDGDLELFQDYRLPEEVFDDLNIYL